MSKISGDEPSRTKQLTWADVIFRLAVSAAFAFAGVTLTAAGFWALNTWPVNGSSFFAIWRTVWVVLGSLGLLLGGLFCVALSVSVLGSEDFPSWSDAASGEDSRTARHLKTDEAAS